MFIVQDFALHSLHLSWKSGLHSPVHFRNGLEYPQNDESGETRCRTWSYHPSQQLYSHRAQYNKKYEFETIPVPQITDNEILIQIAAAGFCHTDFQIYQGVYSSPTPLTGSHEPVGTIVALGETAATKWELGQRVGMLLFKHACGECYGCRAWKDNAGRPDIRMCLNKQMAGLTHDGGFAEYAVADADQASLLPESIDFVKRHRLCALE